MHLRDRVHVPVGAENGVQAVHLEFRRCRPAVLGGPRHTIWGTEDMGWLNVQQPRESGGGCTRWPDGRVWPGERADPLGRRCADHLNSPSHISKSPYSAHEKRDMTASLMRVISLSA
jgi:hypothetical protein